MTTKELLKLGDRIADDLETMLNGGFGADEDEQDRMARRANEWFIARQKGPNDGNKREHRAAGGSAG